MTRTKWTAKKRQTFLDLLSQGWSVTRACRAINVSRSGAYSYREQDPDFAAAWAEAWEAGGDYIEDEMLRRAVEGTLRPVYQGGEEVGQIREYSDTLLIFALKGRRPEKYRERVQNDITSGGQPIQINTIVVEKPGDA
jgi:hypothetical protein